MVVLVEPGWLVVQGRVEPVGPLGRSGRAGETLRAEDFEAVLDEEEESQALG